MLAEDGLKIETDGQDLTRVGIQLTSETHSGFSLVLLSYPKISEFSLSGAVEL